MLERLFDMALFAIGIMGIAVVLWALALSTGLG